MEIRIVRKYFKEEYTIGKMFVNDNPFADTLEDKDRGLSDDMTLSQIKKLKKYGETCIPYGRYAVSVYFWPKYRKKYPLINEIKGFTGVMIHGGSTHKMTLGCPLIGENRIKGQLTNCEKYVRNLTTMCEYAIKRGEKVWVTICRE